MEKIKLVKSVSKIEANIILSLSEEEARALKTITTYGSSEFLKWFYAHLGKHYLKEHEKGLISLFATIKSELPNHLRKIDEARKLFETIEKN